MPEMIIQCCLSIRSPCNGHYNGVGNGKYNGGDREFIDFFRYFYVNCIQLFL